MAHATVDSPTEWPTPVQILLVAVALEAVLVVGYFLATPARVNTPRYVIYPFVWINAVVWAAAKTEIPRASRRAHLVAGGVAVAYFLLLANWAGLFGLTGGGHHGVLDGILGLSIGSGSPGWARVRFITRVVAISFIPYRVIGYLGLAYLVYVAVLDVTGAALSGAVGLLSCLSCSFPILASFATGLFGGSVTLMSTVYAYSVDLSTLAFLLSVALLYYRPGFGAVRRLRPADE
jgi:hypothetical protein